jgi:hypothetical protein
MGESCSSKAGIPGVDMKGLYETWEKAANSWFEAWTKSPAFLSAMGKTMEANLGMKTQANKLFETTLEAWKIPTARDLESISDRISAIEDRIANVEDAVGATAPAASASK